MFLLRYRPSSISRFRHCRFASTHIDAPVRPQEARSKHIDPIEERCKHLLATANVISVTKELAASNDPALIEFGTHLTRYCVALPSISDIIVLKQVKLMIDSLIHANQLDEAKSLLHHCSDRLQSDRALYWSLRYHLAREYAKHGNIEALGQIVADMYGSNEERPLWAKASLVQALARSQRAQEAYAVYKPLEAKGEVSQELVSAVMEVLPSLDFKKALKLLDIDCARWNIVPTASMYDDVIEYSLRGSAKQLDLSIDLVRKQIKAGYEFRPRMLWLVGAKTVEKKRPELTQQVLELWLNQNNYKQSHDELVQDPSQIDRKHDKLVHTMIMYACARKQEQGLRRLLDFSEKQKMALSERLCSHLVTHYSLITPNTLFAVKYLRLICENERTIVAWKKHLIRTINASPDAQIIRFRLLDLMQQRFLVLYSALSVKPDAKSVVAAEACLKSMEERGKKFVKKMFGKEATLDLPSEFNEKRSMVLKNI